MQASDLSDDISTRIQQVFQSAQSVFKDRPVMAKVSTSQAILESGLNQPKISGLALQNNLFGIKGSGTAGTSQMGTQEQVNGTMITVRAGFAINNTLEDSFMQYRELMYHPRYEDVLNASDTDSAFDALQDSGYATDENYSSKLKYICTEYLSND